MAVIAKTAKWSQSTAGVTVRLQVGGLVVVRAHEQLGWL